MKDATETIPNSELRRVGLSTAKSLQMLASEWWFRALEKRWMVALGRSRSLCVAVSILFHVTIVLLFLIRFPSLVGRHDDELPSVVPVDLVTIGDETNMAAMASHQVPFPASNQQVELTATNKKDGAPGLEMRLFPTEPSEQPKPAAQMEEGAEANGGAQQSSLRNATVGDYDIDKVGAGTAMTMSVSDYLRNQIALCWRRARNTGSDIVVFELYLDGSGSIERPPRLIEPTMQTSDSIMAAESVRQAIYTCAPYRLPTNRYQEWRQTTLTFDTRLIGRGARH